ncbi:hypothetical protein CDG79_07450 [Nostoc sp. 'Peltigera membranacea cyanobiont' 232]|nr:hypothetical protein CDG79_07450 [Nostoc sp. 'Peltigera membranacea cyanobiont' 232]
MKLLRNVGSISFGVVGIEIAIVGLERLLQTRLTKRVNLTQKRRVIAHSTFFQFINFIQATGQTKNGHTITKIFVSFRDAEVQRREQEFCLFKCKLLLSRLCKALYVTNRKLC